jgi:phage shock protein E
MLGSRSMIRRFRHVLALSLLVLTGGMGCGIARSHDRIDSKQAHALVQSGAKLVDVRTPAEFADKHVPGAINVPLQELQARMKELEPKDQTLILYCRSGSRSRTAYDQLKKQGFTKIHDLGAMSAW